jgi:hypothetical protein
MEREDPDRSHKRANRSKENTLTLEVSPINWSTLPQFILLSSLYPLLVTWHPPIINFIFLSSSASPPPYRALWINFCYVFIFPPIHSAQESVRRRATGWTARVRFPAVQDFFFTASRLTLGPTQPLSPGVKRQGREADHTSIWCRSEERRSYASSPPYVFMA